MYVPDTLLKPVLYFLILILIQPHGVGAVMNSILEIKKQVSGGMVEIVSVPPVIHLLVEPTALA